MPAMEDDFGFKPLHTSWMLKKSPFPLSGDVRYMLSVLKGQLVREVQHSDFGKRFQVCCQWLHRYVALFGYCFTREDHHLLVKLFYRIILDQPTQTKENLELISLLILDLTKKKKFLTPGELVLDWKPLFDLWISLRAADDYCIHSLPGLEPKAVLELVRNLKIFFDIDAVPDIVREARRLKCRGKTQSPFPRHYLYPSSYQFLPTLVPAGTFDRTVGLWIEDLIDDFMEEDDADALIEMGNVLSDAAFYNCGRVNLDRCMPRIVSMELAQWNVPFDLFEFDRNVIIPIKFKPSDVWINATGRLLVSSITPKSNTLDLLEKIRPALGFVTDPSVFSLNNKAVRLLLSEMVYHLKRRLSQERVDAGSFTKWSEVTPPECRLSDQLVKRIVDFLLPPLETMLFGKIYAEEAANLISSLSVVRPDIVVPRIIDLVKGEFSRLTEPHRVFIALKVSNSILRGVLNISAIAPAAPDNRGWLLDMLPVVMGFISVNDDKKTREACTFLHNFVNHIPIAACRHTFKHADTLCNRSHELEDFLITYTETVLTYAQESIDAEAGQSPSAQHIASDLHRVLTWALMMAPSPLRQRAADLVLAGLEGGRFPWNYTPNEWAYLIKPFVILEPEHCLTRIVKIASQLMAELEDDYECADKEKFPSSIPENQVNEVCAFVMMIFFAPAAYLRTRHRTIEKLFLKCFKFTGSQVTEILSHLIETFHCSFRRYRFRVTSLVESDAGDMGSREGQAAPCFIKHWGLVVHTDSWRPDFQEKPEAEDLAFRDDLNERLVNDLVATILRATARPLLSVQEKAELRLAMYSLASVVGSVSHAPNLCAPIDTHLGAHADMPPDILTERLIPRRDLPEMMVGRRRLWDLLQDTLDTLMERQVDDYETWGAFCELLTTAITGDSQDSIFRDFKSGSKILVAMLGGQDKIFHLGDSKKRDIWMKRKQRFLYDMCTSMENFLTDMHTLAWMVSALSPRRWELLQRFMFAPVPSKEAWPYVYMTSMRCLNAYPDTADHLLVQLPAYLDSLSDEDLRNFGRIPMCRVMCIARFLRRTNTWTPLMREFVRLVSRCQETRLLGNGESKEMPNNANASNALDWLTEAPLLDEVRRQLAESTPTLQRPAPAKEETPEETRKQRVRESEQFLEEMAAVLVDTKEQLLRPILRTLHSIVAGDSEAQAHFPASLAEVLLQLLRTCLNPGVHYSVQDILRDLTLGHSSGRRLEAVELRPERLRELCAWPEADEGNDQEPFVAAAFCSAETHTGFAYLPASKRPESATVALFRERLSDPKVMNEVMDTYLQLQRTARMTSTKHMFAYGLMRTLAVFVGAAVLSPALQSRLIALLEVDETPELVTVYAVMAGLLLNCGSWDRREHEQLCRWLIPVLESGLARSRFSPSSLSENRNPLNVLSTGYLGDPRRLRPLWDFLFSRLQRAQPTLDDRETEQLVHLSVTLLEGFRAWRVVPLIARLDAVLQPLLTDSVLSLRHRVLVNRWLLLSTLPPDDAQLRRLFGAERVEAPSRWLGGLFTPERRSADVQPLPDWIRRLSYLCPNGKVERQYGFGELLIRHLDLVLVARGNNAQVNDETTREALSSLPGLSLVVLRRGGRRETVMAILEKLEAVMAMPDVSDRTLCAALSLWRQTLCRNVVLITDDNVEKAYENICRGLRHEALPVVRATAQATSELLRRGILLPATLLLRLKADRLPSTAIAHGLSAMMEAFPHRLFDELEEVLDEMKLLLRRDGSQRAVVEKAVRNFMRTHQDAWKERWRVELSDSSLDSLRDLCGSGSYFS